MARRPFISQDRSILRREPWTPTDRDVHTARMEYRIGTLNTANGGSHTRTQPPSARVPPLRLTLALPLRNVR